MSPDSFEFRQSRTYLVAARAVNLAHKIHRDTERFLGWSHDVSNERLSSASRSLQLGLYESVPALVNALYAQINGGFGSGDAADTAPWKSRRRAISDVRSKETAKRFSTSWLSCHAARPGGPDVDFNGARV